MMDRRLEASHVFHGLGVHVTRARLLILVKRSENLRVENLEAPNPITQPLQWNAFDHFVFVIDALNT